MKIPAEYKKIEFRGKDSIYLEKYDQWNVKDFTISEMFSFGSDKIMINNEIAEMTLDTVPLEWDWRIPVRPRRTWGFIDSAGLMRISNRYENVKSFSDGFAAIKFEGKWGFIDKNENIIVQPNYDSVSRFENGICVAGKKGKYGLINKLGKEIIPFIFNKVTPVPNGLFITYKGLKQGLVNNAGKEILATRFDHVNPQEDGRTIIERAGKKGLADEIGSIIFPLEYDEIIYSQADKKYFLKKKLPFSFLILKRGK